MISKTWEKFVNGRVEKAYFKANFTKNGLEIKYKHYPHIEALKLKNVITRYFEGDDVEDYLKMLVQRLENAMKTDSENVEKLAEKAEKIRRLL